MTEATDITVLSEAVEIIDRALAQLATRELVSSAEMSDLLLDLRLLLMAAESESTPETLGEAVPG